MRWDKLKPFYYLFIYYCVQKWAIRIVCTSYCECEIFTNTLFYRYKQIKNIRKRKRLHRSTISTCLISVSAWGSSGGSHSISDWSLCLGWWGNGKVLAALCQEQMFKRRRNGKKERERERKRRRERWKYINRWCKILIWSYLEFEDVCVSLGPWGEDAVMEGSCCS